MSDLLRAVGARRYSDALVALMLTTAAAAPTLAQDYGPVLPAPPDAPVAVEPTPYVPVDLQQIVGQAVASAPEVEAARVITRAADFDIEAAKWLRFPSVQAEGFGFATGQRDGLQSQITVEQPVWTGGRISSAIDRARAAKLVTLAEVQEALFDIALEAAEEYFEAVGAARRLVVLVNSLEQHQALVDRIARRVDGGVSPNSDLNLAQSRTAQVEEEIAVTRAAGATAEARLAELLEEPNFALGPPPPYDAARYHPDIPDLVARSVQCDPVRQRLQAETVLARAETKQARAEIFPQLNLQYSRSELLGDRVGVSLRQTTQGGLSAFSNANAARSRAAGSVLDIRSAERALREELAADLVANRAAQRRIEAGAEASRFSTEVRESYARQYVAGRRTWLDLMNAVREEASAEESRVGAEVTAMLTSTRLALRSCQLVDFRAPDVMGKEIDRFGDDQVGEGRVDELSEETLN
ncbi:MAG: TolC family protein [Pacificimonas sp.]